MTTKELLKHQQQSGHICLIRQGLFFRASNQGAVLLSRLCGERGETNKTNKTKMNMKTKMLFWVIVAAMLSTTVGYAQKVETTTIDGQQYPVIDCSKGMLPTAYTTTKKGNTEAELSTEAANAKAYVRLVVSKVNNGSSLWEPAFTVCSGISGGGWRLPTQRELMLMWVLKGELEATSGFTPFGTTKYWSATQSNTTSSWYMDFYFGNTSTRNKTYDNRVRCVREL